MIEPKPITNVPHLLPVGWLQTERGSHLAVDTLGMSSLEWTIWSGDEGAGRSTSSFWATPPLTCSSSFAESSGQSLSILFMVFLRHAIRCDANVAFDRKPFVRLAGINEAYSPGRME